MIKKSYKILPVIFLIFFISLAGCREEIISPGNAASNINEPVQTRSNNSYSFLINAQDISSQVIEYPSLSSSKTRISISINGDVSGSARISFYNRAVEHLYSFFMDDGFKNTANNFSGDSPDVIEIVFKNFSGRLEIRLTRL